MESEGKENITNPGLMKVDLISHTEIDFTEKEVKVGECEYIQHGSDNNYPDYLTELAQHSGTHSSLIKSIADEIYGRGFVPESLGVYPGDEVILNQFLESERRDETGEDQIKKSCLDLKAYGGYFVEVIWNKDGSKVVDVFCSNYESWRVAPRNTIGEATHYWFAKDWKNLHGDNAPKKFMAFNPEAVDSSKPETLHQVLFVKLPSIGSDHYPKPDYHAITMWAEVDKEIGTHHLSNILNGLVPSFHINFANGAPTDPIKRKRVKKKLRDEIGGPKNSGKFFVTWSEGTETAPTLTTFPIQDAHSLYDVLSKQATSQIMVGHRVTSGIIFGVKDAVGFGNNADEMKQAAELFDDRVVKGFQEVAARGWNKIFKAIGIQGKYKLQSNEFADDKTQDPAPDQQNFSSQTYFVIDGEVHDAVLHQLAAIGEDENEVLNDYTLIDEEVVRTDIDPLEDKEYLSGYHVTAPGLSVKSLDGGSGMPILLANGLNWVKTLLAIESSPDKKGKEDRGFFRVRYKYAGPPPIDTSRDFCRQMMTSYNNLLFRKDDIDAMTARNENSQFGKYSIFRYKGSYGCRHHWKRQVYFLKRVPAGQEITVDGRTYGPGQFLPADKMKNFKLIPESQRADTISPPDGTATTVNPKPKR